MHNTSVENMLSKKVRETDGGMQPLSRKLTSKNKNKNKKINKKFAPFSLLCLDKNYVLAHYRVPVSDSCQTISADRSVMSEIG